MAANTNGDATLESATPKIHVNGIKMPDTPAKFSWLDPHPIFVIVLVGPNARPFGIQKDFLCSKSTHYHKHFLPKDAGKNFADPLEYVVKLPDTLVEVFAFAQHYMYTGTIFPDQDVIPTYEILVALWKLGNDLDIDGLCEKVLSAMVEVRKMRGKIPATPLLIKTWREAPEGSTIRELLLSWAAEYMHSSDLARAQFVRALPQEILSELVLMISALDASRAPSATTNGTAAVAEEGALVARGGGEVAAAAAVVSSAAHTWTGSLKATTPLPSTNHQQQRKAVQYFDDDDEEVSEAENTFNSSLHDPPPSKKPRLTEATPNGERSSNSKGAGLLRRGRPPGSTKSAHGNGSPATPASLSASAKRKSNIVTLPVETYPMEMRLRFCEDLLTRMLSGPGFWTRLVGPFRNPVDPIANAVPDYLEKISQPMDLTTMKTKMEAKKYTTDEDFVADMNKIFNNCYKYWSQNDSMYASGQKLESTFRDKYGQMNKWLAKMTGVEPAE